MENAEIDRLVMKPTARRRLGKYVLLGRLGHGGMGKIYLAYAPGPAGIEKLLVVKRLHGHLTSDPVLVNSFLDEARLSMALNHPNIVHTYDVGDVEGRYFMVMEYIEGQNLGVLLRTAKRSGTYPSSSLWAGLFLSILDALHAAHVAHDARGRPLQIIHRDVSPQNILVTYDGLPKLVDFGIAKAAMRVSETDAGVLKGKYAYMSPEQVRGEPLDPRSDVFAAGIVLWEMLAGRRLYKAETIVRSVERILTEQVISPVRVNAECDAEVAKVAFKALQKDRNQRFTTALEMKEALDDALRKGGHRFRQTEVRDLMVRLFGDVIEKQRAVLETCLSQADQPAPPGDDDDNEPRRPSDSESDLSMKSLREKSEVTTPSVVRQSPLVTQDSERFDEKGATSLERRPKNTPALQPTTPNPAAPAPEITATAGGVRPKRAGFPLVPVAAGLALLAALGAAAVVYMQHDAAHPEAPPELALVDPSAPATTSPPTPSAPTPSPPATSPPTTSPPTTSPPTTSPTTPTTPPTTTTPTTPTAPTAPTTPTRTPAVNAIPLVEPRVASEVTRKPFVKKVKVEEKPKEPALADDAKPGETGTLSLDTVPWTIVYLGKKKLGETPLVKVPVPAGQLELVLVNPDENLREQYIANVKAGGEFRARLDLH